MVRGTTGKVGASMTDDPKWREPTPDELRAYEALKHGPINIHNAGQVNDFKSFMVGLAFGFAFGVGITLVVML